MVYTNVTCSEIFTLFNVQNHFMQSNKFWQKAKGPIVQDEMIFKPLNIGIFSDL